MKIYALKSKAGKLVKQPNYLTIPAAIRELEELHKKQKALQSKELLKVIAGSSRSFEEILEFIQGSDELENE